VRASEGDGESGERDGESGPSHEVVSIAEALAAAKAVGLDLVEVNGKASPPVCRIMDYERTRYDQKKRAKEQKKAQAQAQKRDVMKELRLTAKIDAHDLNTKVNGAKKFLDAGNRVSFRIMFKNNDGVAAEKRAARGAEIMEQVFAQLDDVEVVKKPAMVGPAHMTASVMRSKKKK
jgi:translation initiation factor IF-3